MTPQLRTPDFHNRGQTRRAYKRLIRFIRSEGLGRGEKLPAQQELWRKLGLNNSTLGGAMQMLVSTGALTRKTRVGTVIADPTKIPPVEWAVGVITPHLPPQGTNSFFTSLTVRMQQALAHQNCRCTAYVHADSGHDPLLSAVPPVHLDLERGDLDGLVLLTSIPLHNWREIESRGVVLCHTPIWREAPCGVIIDEAEMASRAIEIMAGRGAKKIALVHTSWEFDRREQTLVERSLALAKLAPCDLIQFKTEPGVLDGQRIASSLLQKPEQDRPEGIIVFDDHFAMGMTSVLREAGNYSPMIAVQTNRQLPLVYGLPVIPFEVDIDELTRRTAALMLERLVNPATAARVERFAPQLKDGFS
ncbi:MAG: GntR family transcriptional regulator [Phycisphaeraceae bacterium]|nr:GntR family transcriptional regulator [Phycisphaeraceae bacterium]